MPGLTNLPTTDVNSLGPDRVDRSAYGNETWKVPALWLNRVRDYVIAMAQMLGLADGSTAGSLQQRMNALDPLIQMPSYGTIQRNFSIEHFCTISSGLTSYVGFSSGTGAGVGNAAYSTNGRVGIVTVQTGSTSTGKAYFQSSTSGIRLGYGRFRYRGDIFIPVLSNGTDTFRVFSGLHDSTPDVDGTDGCGFRYTHSVNGGRFLFVTRQAGVETTFDTGITVAANTWYSLELEIDAAGAVAKGWINGTLVATSNTNIPISGNATGIMPVGIAKSLGTTACSVYIDLAAWSFEPSAPV